MMVFESKQLETNKAHKSVLNNNKYSKKKEK